MIFTLDTNILIHLLRGSDVAEWVRKEYLKEAAPTLIVSIVSQAEIESIALQRNYGERKLGELRKLLSEFLIIPVDNVELVKRYAEIDAYSQGKLAARELPNGFTSRNMGKNDIWIAATASLTRSVLLTTDSDFDHLQALGYLNVTKVPVL